MKRTIIQGVLFLVLAFVVAGGINLTIAWLNPPPEPTIAEGTGVDDTETPATTPRGVRRRPPEEPDDDDLSESGASPLEPTEEDDPRIVPVMKQIVIIDKEVSEHLAAFRQRETELTLIQHDYRAEQELVGKLRETIDARIELATRELTAAGLIQDRPRFQQQPVVAVESDSTAAAVLAQPDQKQTGLRQIAQVYDRMPEKKPAEIFRRMTEDGLEETVVLILSVMNERTLARILGNIAENDSALAGRLTIALSALDGNVESDSTSESESDAATTINKTPPVTEPAAS